MATSSVISSLGAAATPATSSLASSTGGTTLDKNAFLNLLTTQLRYQNPLDPMSDSDFASQLAQFSSLEGIQQMNGSLNNLLLMQQMTQGAGMIGKTIQFARTDSTIPGHGVVDSVQIDATGNTQLVVAGKSVALNQVRSIQAT